MSDGKPDRATVLGRWQHEVEISRSRFRAVAVPLLNEDDWQIRLAELQDPGASHCCWAWRFGQTYRSSDAGEPAGTAGRPILAAIDGLGFDRTLVAVLRWFGGIKLGVGGLVRAYGGTAAECLRKAPRVTLVDRTLGELRCDFEHADAIYRLLALHRASVQHSHFASDGIHLRVELPRASIEQVQRELGNATRGRGQLLIPG
jgi:putative IMPACT (imprinted ancient) family translation regulator